MTAVSEIDRSWAALGCRVSIIIGVRSFDDIFRSNEAYDLEDSTQNSEGLPFSQAIRHSKLVLEGFHKRFEYKTL